MPGQPCPGMPWRAQDGLPTAPGAKLDFSHHHKLQDLDTSCQPWGTEGLLWIYSLFFPRPSRREISFPLSHLYFWISFGMGLVAPQESPSAGRENTALQHSWNLGKSTRGWNTWCPGIRSWSGDKRK